jgi:hypothetical protein
MLNNKLIRVSKSKVMPKPMYIINKWITATAVAIAQSLLLK